MVDLHCHIVPGVDDGSADLEMSIAMINEAEAQGVTAILTTPHILGSIGELGRHRIHREHFVALTLKYTGPVRLMLGGEVHVDPDIIPALERKEFTYGEQGKYILLELPSREIPLYFPQVLFETKMRGITPIIAHPERNLGYLLHPSALLDHVRTGAHLQLTCGALTGGMGPQMEHFSQLLIKHRLVSFLSSDAHNVTTRPFSTWDGCKQLVQELSDTDYWERISLRNGEAVLNSQQVASVEIDEERYSELSQIFNENLRILQKKRKRFFFF